MIRVVSVSGGTRSFLVYNPLGRGVAVGVAALMFVADRQRTGSQSPLATKPHP